MKHFIPGEEKRMVSLYALNMNYDSGTVFRYILYPMFFMGEKAQSLSNALQMRNQQKPKCNQGLPGRMPQCY